MFPIHPGSKAEAAAKPYRTKQGETECVSRGVLLRRKENWEC